MYPIQWFDFPDVYIFCPFNPQSIAQKKNMKQNSFSKASHLSPHPTPPYALSCPWLFPPLTCQDRRGEKSSLERGSISFGAMQSSKVLCGVILTLKCWRGRKALKKRQRSASHWIRRRNLEKEGLLHDCHPWLHSGYIDFRRRQGYGCLSPWMSILKYSLVS